MDQFQTFIHKSRYARWRDDLGRREDWPETVQRYFDFFGARLKGNAKKAYKEIRPELEAAVLNLEVMPSMRCLMTAGPALERDEVAGYNCSYLPVDHPRAFDETMYILLCGTGVGFSVERQAISKLPEVPEQLVDTDTTIQVADSKIGWASAYKELLGLLWAGQIPKWDLSRIRPAGARLKVFGGRASGPDPLDDLFRFTISVFKKAQGRKLNSIECHDLMCKIGDVVVVGGVRRSALISLSNLSDDRMRHAKSGQWWETDPHRALANNSVVYTEKPDMGAFMQEWYSLYDSKSGERGIFYRKAARNCIPERRDPEHEWGTNPCSEIILRPHQFCNLTEVVVRANDTQASLKRKARLATILGTLQSTLVNFRYLRKVWHDNTAEERLLGVSLTGIMDSELTSDYGLNGVAREMLPKLKKEVLKTNEEWAGILKIPVSAATTCVKPSGTVSQLVNSASGIHPRYSRYYIRTVRADKNDPLAKYMVEKGFPVEDDVTKPTHTWVFSFPVESPDGSVMRDEMSAIEQLEMWRDYQEFWCEHKPSITVYVRENEWLAVGAWVYDNFDKMSGVSFLPHTEHNYRQAPYQEITEEQYKELKAKIPVVDWVFDEEGDSTTSSQEFACTSGACDIL